MCHIIYRLRRPSQGGYSGHRPHGNHFEELERCLGEFDEVAVVKDRTEQSIRQIQRRMDLLKELLELEGVEIRGKAELT